MEAAPVRKRMFTRKDLMDRVEEMQGLYNLGSQTNEMQWTHFPIKQYRTLMWFFVNDIPLCIRNGQVRILFTNPQELKLRLIPDEEAALIHAVEAQGKLVNGFVRSSMSGSKEHREEREKLDHLLHLLTSIGYAHEKMHDGINVERKLVDVPPRG